jgi:putative CocE/NonD family hydrolase
MPRGLLSALTAIATASLLPGASRESFDSFSQRTEMVPMRDGVKLSSDVYLPAKGGQPVAGKFPVLVERTPYSGKGRRRSADLLARRGYAVIIQDCRGRYASEGKFTPFEDGPDGYDTIEWAAMQPWSDGRVGTFGGSYTGMDQYYASMLRPPHLVGMFVQMAGSSLYDSVSYPGGTPNEAWMVWLLRDASTSQRAAQHKEAAAAIDQMIRTNLSQWMKQPPTEREKILSEFPDQREAFRDSYRHASLDTFWKARRFYTAGYYEEMKDVPMMFVTGWYDQFMDGTIEVFSALSRMQKTEKKLMVGPWPHGIGTDTCGNATFGAGTTEDQAALVADWFDHVLRQVPFALISDETVQTFRMGGGNAARDQRGKLNVGGGWHTSPTWPPPGIRQARYYIHGDGSLNTAIPANEEASRYEFDPADPVPSLGGRYQIPGVPPCVQNQNTPRLDKRPDILSYSSAPLDTRVELSGRIRASLAISSDAPDTDFTAKLMDVFPDGYALILADGELRVRYRNSLEKPELMKPGEVYQVVIDLGSTSTLFGAGHRIRVDISSSNFPKFEPNPNTGEAVGAWTHLVKAHNVVYHDAKRLTYIDLPLAATP